ncbi:hypothetical protein [Clostridioides sp. ES-S-0001-03]|uniref:hypothetical protein n=1 Tax=Clostridioides sp. ES-S-0001-03 TaxID=2770771 RepID=UPI001D0C1855|nr:hypothetical protein [Clostridioides sp. ES-S-0001-03]
MFFYAISFKIALDEINIDFENTDYPPGEKETFRVGEEINEKIKQLLKAGILSGELREDIEIMPTIFSLWGMLSGIIQTAPNKEAYIKQEVKLSKQEFLKHGFDMLYRSIYK